MMKILIAVSVALSAVFMPEAFWIQKSVRADGEGPKCLLQNGDVNNDNSLDLSDAVYVLFHLFMSGPAPTPQAVADEECVSTLLGELTACRSDLSARDVELTATKADLAAANARIQALEVRGCTNSRADNFDVRANIDDGSCVISGCTDPAASNYDPEATRDDGTCLLSGDIHGFTSLGNNVQGYPEYRHIQSGIIFVRLPGGTFNMGSNIFECGRDAQTEGPVHQVTLTGFLIGKYEITQAQWEAVTGSRPSDFIGSDLPVTNVSWEQALEFCNILGLTLPSEAQWEYACRSKSLAPFSEGTLLNSQSEANFRGNDPICTYATGSTYIARTTIIGSYAPNGYGIHDMHGNVTEFCKDIWNPSFYSSPEAIRTDPLCQEPANQYRPVRGGSWNSPSTDCRSAVRRMYGPFVLPTGNDSGFRAVYWPMPVQ